MRLALLLCLGLSLAAVAQQPGPARTSLNIHPQSHWSAPKKATPAPQGPMLIVTVENTGSLANLSTLQGKREDHPPDPSRNDLYQQPIFPVVQF
ncbi:MAG TPA: hypothetical protein VGO93_20575 [Candidatus Xenobia bacterium]|jgi:hypothetical protein